jgi:hypothetical protein
MNGDADLYRQALEAAGRARVDAQRMHERALATARELAPKAKEAGVSVSEIAGLLSITRRRVYALL